MSLVRHTTHKNIVKHTAGLQPCSVCKLFLNKVKMESNDKWNEQDAALFGNNTIESTTNFSKTFSVDEELAKKLQELYLEEKIVAERTDRDFVSSRIRQQDTQSHTADEGSRGSVGHTTGSRMRNFIKNRQKQEDEDATFARAIQKEEEARAEYPDQNLSSPTSRMENGPDNPTRERHNRNGLIPTFAVCDGVVIMPINALGNFYHTAYLKCIGCHDQISTNERFAYTQSEDGKKYPLHKQSYAELYGLKCTVCQKCNGN